MTHIPRLYNRHHGNAPPEAVYIGRGSPYGNPYTLEDCNSREESCILFEQTILPHLDVGALKGKDLVCFCAPARCHGDSILRKANPDIVFTFREPVRDKLNDLAQACEEARARKQHG